MRRLRDLLKPAPLSEGGQAELSLMKMEKALKDMQTAQEYEAMIKRMRYSAMIGFRPELKEEEDGVQDQH